MATLPKKRPAMQGALSSFAEQVNQSVNLAMVSTLRTENKLLDTLLCIILPLAIRYLLITDYRRVLSIFQNFFRSLSMRRPYLRTIEYTEGGNLRIPVNDSLAVDCTDRNNLLQRAIRLYLGDHYQLKADELDTSLVPLRKVKVQEEKCPMFGTKRVFNGSYEQLLSFGVRAMPRFGLWIEVDEKRRIWFMQTKETIDPSGEGKSVMNKTTFNIKAYGPNASNAVAEWIDEAFEWYKEQRKAERDTSRYFFVAVPHKKKEEAKGGDQTSFIFKQYKLSDHKTFTSLFFREKDSLLQLIDQFLNKEGKFAIEGFPNKLGLLLDGPPGTGKTSMIKALAHYTQRHVVSVNLTKVKTNQELMDLFFDRVFAVQGGEFPLKMSFEDLIFVMEDVDAASKVVCSRKSAKAKTPKKGAGLVSKPEEAGELGAPRASAADAGAGEAGQGSAVPPAGPALQRSASASSGADARRHEGGKQGDVAEPAPAEEQEDEPAESPRHRKEEMKVGAMVGELLCKIAGAGAASDSDGEGGKRPPFAYTSSRAFFDEDDELNLAGLLNVLDGVVDSPGRIVIMTSNHPERLDPALIRPGRINKRIHLGYVQPESLCAMVEHYLEVALSQADRERLSSRAEKRVFTPAQVEQCCAESTGLDDLISRLDAFL